MVNILFLDDDRDHFHALIGTLKKYEVFDVSVVRDMEEAIKLTREKVFEVLVLLPDFCGKREDVINFAKRINYETDARVLVINPEIPKTVIYPKIVRLISEELSKNTIRH